MPTLLGSIWKYLGGKARRYLNTETGESIARRAYDKLTAAAGLRTRKDLAAKAKNDRKQREYERIVARYVEKREAEGRPISKGEARKSAELKEHYRTLQASYKPGKRTKADNQARAKALEALGLRGGIPDWVPPGASDGYKKGVFTKADVRNFNRSGAAGRLARSRGRGIVS